MFATATSVWRRAAATAEVTTSGIPVPAATTVSPMTRSGSQTSRDTTSSEPAVSRTSNTSSDAPTAE